MATLPTQMTPPTNVDVESAKGKNAFVVALRLALIVVREALVTVVFTIIVYCILLFYN